MKTMTVRDIRLNRPAAEKALARVGEIVVTRHARREARGADPAVRILVLDPPEALRRDGAPALDGELLAHPRPRPVERRAAAPGPRVMSPYLDRGREA